jgi:uncharacterized protein YheU (UPF0270 family)
MRVPHTLLSTTALRSVIEEIVTRDGTDYSPVERRIAAVLTQLNSGEAELQFDNETKSCSVVSKQKRSDGPNVNY